MPPAFTCDSLELVGRSSYGVECAPPRLSSTAAATPPLGDQAALALLPSSPARATMSFARSA